MTEKAVKLDTLDLQIIENSIKTIINSGNWSTILTLVDGELLFGDLHYLPRFFDGTPEEAEKAGLWIPDKGRSRSSEWRFAYQLRPVPLVFNSEEGTKHGRAREIIVRDGLISGIRPLPWTDESLSFQTLKNIPNPMASLICKHNIIVAAKYVLFVSELIECALDETAIPSGGIEFRIDEIIYADWEFFSRMTGRSLSIGAYGVSVGLQRSLNELAKSKLTNGVVQKIERFLPGKRAITECRLEGFAVVPELEITTSIEGDEEGDECIVVVCADQRSLSSATKFAPVLMKRRSISYPIEFIPFLNAKLVFYGELKQIPIRIGNVQSNFALLARAIGYIRR